MDARKLLNVKLYVYVLPC